MDDKKETPALPQRSFLSFTLTPSLPRATDPVGDNPYPAGTLLHRVWSDATLEAEESMCRLLQTPRLGRPILPLPISSIAGPHSGPTPAAISSPGTATRC
jgi:hypothetical protein